MMFRPTAARPPSVTRRRSIARAVCLVAVATVALSGCAQSVSLEAGPDSNDPGCAEIIVRLPAVLPSDAENAGIRQTDAQATAAWGSPASILLRCGIEPLGPTTLPCININGVDWVEDDSQAPTYRYVTYGRVPATEVIIDSGVVSGTSTLVDLTSVIQNIPQTSACVGADDAVHIPTDATG